MLRTRWEIIAPLLAACPSFAEQWAEFKAEWHDAAELPLYLALGDMARHVAHLLGAGDVAAVRRFLAAVEALLGTAEGDAREALVIGIVEALQNGRLYPAGTQPEALLPLLGPVSRGWWDEVERFWRGEIGSIGERYQGPEGKPR